MKIFFFLSLIISTLFPVAQIRTAAFLDRTVRIFPYRIQAESSWAQNASYYDEDTENNYGTNSTFDKYAVPYCPTKLDDGEYIVYFKPEFERVYEGKSKKQIMNGDSLNVAINFSIKNGVKEGFVNFYNLINQKKPLVKGNYLNDEKSGLWQVKLYGITIKSEFTSGKLNGKTEIIENRNKIKHLTIDLYKDGLKHGISEKYLGKKLTETTTYRNGETYGPYLISYPQKGGDIIYSGFHLTLGSDSFTKAYKKDKLLYSSLNSPTPFIGMDTTDMDWYVNPYPIDQDIERYKKIAKTKKKYTNFYSINKDGKIANQRYMVNDKIKIPFVFVDEFGDTIFKSEPIEKTDTSIDYKTFFKILNKNKKINRIMEYMIHGSKFLKIDTIIYPVFENTGDYYLRRGHESEITYYPKFILKEFTLNKKLPEYKGWITKRDSVVKLDIITMKPIEIKEQFEIKGEGQNIEIQTIFAKDGSTTKSHFPDLSFKLLGNDTIEITEKSIITDSLISYFTQKINTADSIIKDVNKNLISLKMIGFGGLNNIEHIGESNESIEYKGKPYTGSVIVIYIKSKKVKKITKKLNFDKENETIYINIKIPKTSKFENFINKFNKKLSAEPKPFYNYDLSGQSVETFNFYYTKGKLDGNQSAISADGSESYNLNFREGISHGSQWYKMNNYYSYQSYGNSLSNINYDSGRIDGYVTLIYNRGLPRLLTKYNKGKLNGSFVAFENSGYPNSATPLVETNFKNDTLVNDIVISKFGIEKERIPFKNGKATGYYYKNYIQFIYNEMSDSLHNSESYIKTYIELKAKLLDGQIVDTVFAYYEGGNTKYIAVMDTDFHHQFIFQVSKSGLMPQVKKESGDDSSLIIKGQKNLRDSYASPNSSQDLYFEIQIFYDEAGLDLDPLYDKPKASFTFYYKNGLKSQEGKMAGGKKYGTWKYWNENGVMMKEIEYKTGIDSSTIHKIYYKGRIRGYYPSGKKMCDGLITDEEFSYQCSQESEVTFEEIYYLNFMSEAGDSVLIKQSGSVTDFHINGNKRFVGQVTNGLRTGFWRFYDPTGNLNALGEYADGQKQGKWLEGDLGGVNYLDNACSVNEALSLMKERQQQDIDVTETLYEMGVKISESHLVLEKF